MQRCIAGAIYALLIALTATAAHGAPTGVNIPGTPFSEYKTTDSLGREIKVYVSKPKTPSPILLWIQGSGCTNIFLERNGRYGSTMPGLLPFAAEGRFTIVAVEKPFAGELPGAERGTATACSRRFNEEFTAERWLAALQAGLKAARALPWVDRSRTLVLGHSEGASMAAMVAGHDPTVTDVIFFAGPGVTPYYAGIASDYQTYSTPAERAARLEEREAQVRAIFQKPDSVDDFAWGHPYRRWASFYRLSSVDELTKSRARVYIGIAMSDQNVSPLATEALAAELLVRGKDVTVRRILDADHGFNLVGDTKGSVLHDEYSRAFTWFWDGPQASLRR